MEAKIVACYCFFLRPMVATQTRIWKLSQTGHEQVTNRSRTKQLSTVITPQQPHILSPLAQLYVVDAHLNVIN